MSSPLATSALRTLESTPTATTIAPKSALRHWSPLLIFAVVPLLGIIITVTVVYSDADHVMVAVTWLLIQVDQQPLMPKRNANHSSEARCHSTTRLSGWTCYLVTCI